MDGCSQFFLLRWSDIGQWYSCELPAAHVRLNPDIQIPFGKWDSTAAWRGPLYLQCLPAGINLIFVLFISESPRWLFAQGKVEQARDVLAKFHSKTGDRHSPLIDLELAEFEENISQSGSDKQFWNFKTLFATRGDRYRFGLCMMVSVWGQLAGNGLLTCKSVQISGQVAHKQTFCQCCSLLPGSSIEIDSEN
jgi:hypothetical protein